LKFYLCRLHCVNCCTVWQCCCLLFGCRAFSVVGPAAWNSLPDYLRDLTRSVDSFRGDLKTLNSRSTSIHRALGASRLCAIQIYYWHWHWYLLTVIFMLHCRAWSAGVAAGTCTGVCCGDQWRCRWRPTSSRYGDRRDTVWWWVVWRCAAVGCGWGWEHLLNCEDVFEMWSKSSDPMCRFFSVQHFEITKSTCSSKHRWFSSDSLPFSRTGSDRKFFCS